MFQDLRPTRGWKHPGELDDLLLGNDVEHKEFDESAANDVQFMTCPKCGHAFPK